jgi:hypothetical protein
MDSAEQPVEQQPKRRGRRRHEPPLTKRLVSMTDAQAKLLRMWGRGDLSAGLRWLINAAEPLVRRSVDDAKQP